jgi:hypothetical protein
MIITIAWKETHRLPVPGTGRADLGILPDFEEHVSPVAVVWVFCGDERDLDKALAFAKKSDVGSGHIVSSWPDDTPDPLAKAKALIIAETVQGAEGVG